MFERDLYRFAESEFGTASSELAKRSPVEALVSFYRRHDSAVAKAIEASPSKPACHSGCSYCCYYKVEARAVEVLAIHQYVLAKFKPELIQEVLKQANQNVAEARSMTHLEHLATNQRCPFLINNQCSIYSVRPSKCRNFHAADLQGCKDSYEQPTNLSIPNSYIPGVFLAANGVTEGFERATEESGIDPRVYDLNSALVEIFQNPKVGKRLRSGKKAFISAKVVELPIPMPSNNPVKAAPCGRWTLRDKAPRSAPYLNHSCLCTFTDRPLCKLWAVGKESKRCTLRSIQNVLRGPDKSDIWHSLSKPTETRFFSRKPQACR